MRTGEVSLEMDTQPGWGRREWGRRDGGGDRHGQGKRRAGGGTSLGDRSMKCEPET